MTDDYTKRLAERNAIELRELQLLAELRKAQDELPTHDRTLDKLRAAVARITELHELLAVAKLREAELEQLLDDARNVALVLEGETDLCPLSDWHDAYPYRAELEVES